eukprot:TRINITY_DN14773_c0_g1_i1.p1 TRINITY_DN14773_c0_g1~~TRINITY_DN14773_c0_g1_i1.p1  ORF type:complete len:601 (+),score=157.49 TRINITY_DN14773_c0_g1_i1:53-1804(+)
MAGSPAGSPTGGKRRMPAPVPLPPRAAQPPAAAGRAGYASPDVFKTPATALSGLQPSGDTEVLGLRTCDGPAPFDRFPTMSSGVAATPGGAPPPPPGQLWPPITRAPSDRPPPPAAAPVSGSEGARGRTEAAKAGPRQQAAPRPVSPRPGGKPAAQRAVPPQPAEAAVEPPTAPPADGNRSGNHTPRTSPKRSPTRRVSPHKGRSSAAVRPEVVPMSDFGRVMQVCRSERGGDGALLTWVLPPGGVGAVDAAKEAARHRGREDVLGCLESSKLDSLPKADSPNGVLCLINGDACPPVLRLLALPVPCPPTFLLSDRYATDIVEAAVDGPCGLLADVTGDGTELWTFGLLVGDQKRVESVSAGAGFKSHKKGGMSQARYDRLDQQSRDAYVKRVAEQLLRTAREAGAAGVVLCGTKQMREAVLRRVQADGRVTPPRARSRSRSPQTPRDGQADHDSRPSTPPAAVQILGTINGEQDRGGAALAEARRMLSAAHSGEKASTFEMMLAREDLLLVGYGEVTDGLRCGNVRAVAYDAAVLGPERSAEMRAAAVTDKVLWTEYTAADGLADIGKRLKAFGGVVAERFF